MKNKNNLLCRVQTDLIQAGTKQLINNIYLTLHSQERIGLIGENGSGKTTLMNYIKENQSGVSLYGSLASAPQEIDLSLHTISVREYLSEILPEWTHYTMYEPLQQRNIDPMTLLQDLSGGQRKRIALLGVTLSESDIWLFDEPTNHLDSIGKKRLTSLLSIVVECYVLVMIDLSWKKSVRLSGRFMIRQSHHIHEIIANIYN